MLFTSISVQTCLSLLPVIDLVLESRDLDVIVIRPISSRPSKQHPQLVLQLDNSLGLQKLDIFLRLVQGVGWNERLHLTHL